MPVTKKETENLSTPERTSQALSQLRAKPNAKGAHFFRTSYRRLQTWFENVDGFALDKGQKRTIKYLDKVLRACGKLRNTELHLKMLKQIEVDGDVGDRSSVEQVLKNRQDKRREALTDLLQQRTKLEVVWPALEKMKTLDSNHRGNTSHQNHLQAALRDYASYAQRRPAVNTENLHEYRLTCKAFRYRAELAGETAEPVLKLFKDVQDAIGEWHDWQLLVELSEKKLRKHPSKLLTKIEEITATKLANAFRAVEIIEPQLLKAASEELERKPVKSAQRSHDHSQRRKTA